MDSDTPELSTLSLVALDTAYVFAMAEASGIAFLRSAVRPGCARRATRAKTQPTPTTTAS